MKKTDIIITNYDLMKQKKAKITCLCDFCFLLFSFFLLLAIRRRLKSHFKNSCFAFYRCFQTLENNKSPRPKGLGLSSLFSCVETPVKHSHSFLKYYLLHLVVTGFFKNTLTTVFNISRITFTVLTFRVIVKVLL